MAMRGPIELRPALREALIAAVAEPWRVDLERSAEVMRNAVRRRMSCFSNGRKAITFQAAASRSGAEMTANDAHTLVTLSGEEHT